ncbi:MAG: zinc ABC transporter substrate-binding protein, partial [Lachnospiraceae bacterium]|nr:zinc ABC transporter substrate-binding protein [Lachnospiraceae bacterium]
MKKHRLFSAILVCMLLAIAVSGCGSSQTPSKKEEGKLLVVTTIFPLYDWAREVTGAQADEIELVCLLENGADYHSFQPSAAHIAKIAEADVFIFTGGGSESWAEEAVKNRRNPSQKAVRLFTVLEDRLLLEEHVEGMEEEHEEGNDVEYDEHLFLSLVNAKRAVSAIAGALSEADPAHKADFEANEAAYLEKLFTLDKAYRETVQNARRDTILFGDRFPFRYLCEDYGLRYYAAFQGCSADAEASFQTVAFLSEKVKELSLPSVLTLEKSDHKLAET